VLGNQNRSGTLIPTLTSNGSNVGVCMSEVNNQGNTKTIHQLGQLGEDDLEEIGESLFGQERAGKDYSSAEDIYFHARTENKLTVLDRLLEQKYKAKISIKRDHEKRYLQKWLTKLPAAKFDSVRIDLLGITKEVEKYSTPESLTAYCVSITSYDGLTSLRTELEDLCSEWKPVAESEQEKSEMQAHPNPKPIRSTRKSINADLSSEISRLITRPKSLDTRDVIKAINYEVSSVVDVDTLTDWLKTGPDAISKFRRIKDILKGKSQ